MLPVVDADLERLEKELKAVENNAAFEGDEWLRGSRRSGLIQAIKTNREMSR
jgi:hypothetical protein